MSSFRTSRRHGTDLLARPPCGVRMYENGWAALIVDPTEQLKTLADLLSRGLLSPQEYERQKAKVIEP
jgi:Short C-terminal domain